jgi:hypothetical protein
MDLPPSAGALLEVFDEWTQPQVRAALADEIDVKAPVLRVVEPERLCGVSGRLSEEVGGEAWAEELRSLPQLEQVTRDGGTGLAKGVPLVQADFAAKARWAWQRAEQAMDRWCVRERAWQRTVAALRLFTPEGELTTPAQAAAVRASK